jgi:hypothetical protein
MFWNRKSESEWTGDDVPHVAPRHPLTRQYYSVGLAENDQIALTLYSPGGVSTSVTMNASACKQLMHMLKSAVDVVEANQHAEE